MPLALFRFTAGSALAGGGHRGHFHDGVGSAAPIVLLLLLVLPDPEL